MRYRLIPEEVRIQLAAPFPASAVDWRPGKVSDKPGRPPAALAMAYIDAREVVNRLDSVVGVDAWQSEHMSIGDKQIACRIGIQFGDGWVWKSDGTYIGDLDFRENKDPSKEEGRVEMEGKGSFSVALKRAAVHWGIGRYLYDIGAVWAEVEKRGNSWAFSDAGLRKLDGIADRLYREANQGKAGRMPVREPDDEDRRSSSEEQRPAPRASVGDHAAAAQTGVEQRGGQPVRSAPTVAANETRPAVESPWESLCVDFERRAATESPTALYDEVTRSPLPDDMKCRATLAVVLRAFEAVDNAKDLDGWSEVAAAAKLHLVYEPRLQAGWEAAERRLAKKAS
jgi:hypothetical protein